MTSRDVARRVLARVAEGAYGSLALAAELDRARLIESDRGLATELVYGVLRNRARLDRALASCTDRDGPLRLDDATLDALRIAAYQILFLRVAAHAAVDDAVGFIKKRRSPRLAGFGNAVLRRLSRNGEPAVPDPATLDGSARLDAIATAESTPRWIVDEAVRVLPPDEAHAFLAASNRPAPVWLRANTTRTTVDELQARLANERPRAHFAGSRVITEALAVTHAGDPSATDSHAQGLCLVQDLGAQAIARLLLDDPGASTASARPPAARERLLDACAGIGGKSTHLAQLAPRATIDAADENARKLDLLADHARRLGFTSIRAVRADLTDPDSATLARAYHRVLLDAPCSGLGVLRRHPELKWRRTPADIESLATLQGRLLDALAQRVASGGVLVYAVCTFTTAEGPGRVRAFLDTHPEFSFDDIPPSLAAFAIPGARGELRTWPHRDDADAFYAARLRRND